MKKYRRIFLIVRNRKNICKYGMSMEKQEIINKYKNDEDKLLVSKLLDKIKWARTKNKITNTDFLLRIACITVNALQTLWPLPSCLMRA